MISITVCGFYPVHMLALVYTIQIFIHVLETNKLLVC